MLATSALWTFKLGGTVPPAAAPTPPPTETTFRGRVESTDKVEMGATLNDMGLDKTRTYFDEAVFKPIRIKVKAGTTVTFTNNGKTPHNPSAQDGSWSAGEVAPGASATVKLDKPGVYTYVDKDHPWSYGQITVQ